MTGSRIARLRVLITLGMLLGLFAMSAQPGMALNQPGERALAVQDEGSEDGTPITDDDGDSGIFAIGGLTKGVSDDTPDSGDVITYTLDFDAVERGAISIDIVDQLPDGLVLDIGSVVCAATVGNCVSSSSDNNTVSVSVSGGGESGTDYDIMVTYTVTVTAAPGAQVTNIACAVDTSPQLNDDTLSRQGFAQAAICGNADSRETASLTITVGPTPPEPSFGTPTKTAVYPQVLPGGYNQYTIQIPFTGGQGGADAYGVSFVDQVPDGYVIGGAFCDFDPNVSCNNVTFDAEVGSVLLEATILNKSQSATVTLFIYGQFAEDAAPGTYTNTACVTTTESFKRVSSNRYFAQPAPACEEGTTVSASVEVLEALPQVPPTITKSVDTETASAGDILTYTVTYQSTRTAPFGIVIDDLPDNVTFLPETFQCSATDFCSLAPPEITQPGTILYGAGPAPGDPNYVIDVTFTYQVQINGDVAVGDEVTNTACVASFPVDTLSGVRSFAQPFPQFFCSEITDSTTVTIVEPPEPIVPTLTKTVDDDTPAPGETVTYTVNFIGTNAPSSVYTIGDDVPDGLTLDPTSITCSPTVNCTVVPDPDGDVVVQVTATGEGNIFNIAITYEATVDEDAEIGSTLTNLACATAPLVDVSRPNVGTRAFAQAPVCGEDDPQDSVDITVTPNIPPVDPVVTKDASDSAPQTGELLAYTVRFQSTGNDGAYQLSDAIPDGLTLVGDVTCTATLGSCGTFDPTEDGDIVGVAFGEGPQSSIDVTISYQVMVDAENGTTIINTACANPLILGSTTDPSVTRGFAQPAACAEAVAVDDAAITVTAPVPGEIGQITKTVNTAAVAPGDPVAYTVVVPYAGGEDAEPVGFRIEDTVPASLTNVTWTCTAVNAVCDPESGSGDEIVVEGNITNPAIDATVTLTIEAIVAEDAVAGLVTNEACTIPILVTDVSPTRGFAQEPTNCASADLTISAQPATTTPEPGTPLPNATPTPPVGSTATPDPEDRDIVGLPNTGLGNESDGGSSLPAIGLMIAACAATVVLGLLAVHRQVRQR